MHVSGTLRLLQRDAPKSLQKLSIYIPWLFPPIWRVANITRTTRGGGDYVAPLAMTRDLATVWTALLECHSPSSLPFHNICRFIMPDPLLPLPQGYICMMQPRGNSRCLQN